METFKKGDVVYYHGDPDRKATIKMIVTINGVKAYLLDTTRLWVGEEFTENWTKTPKEG